MTQSSSEEDSLQSCERCGRNQSPSDCGDNDDEVCDCDAEADPTDDDDEGPIDCLPESDSGEDYEFLGDDPPLGETRPEPESSPFVMLDMGGYSLHPR